MTIVAFDFDGTLSDSEMTVLLGNQCGVADEMDEITERAMNDEIEYAESLRSRAALLEDLPEEKADAAYDEVRLREDAAETIRRLNEADVYTAILTGGFERGVAAALSREGVEVDEIVANRLPVEDGALSGEVEGPLIEGTKDDALANLAEREGVEMTDTIAVGDGANDLPMLEVAGLSVGFEPKAAVEPACEIVVESFEELQDVLAADGVLSTES
ncbi:phosphoserine phosphatase SerB [Natranaeroarchaeum aerophilus]|uniref:phosphoserine phosphatase n=1 Tax=Natranaeroarchaeum aerophilus TaxID=2917711 RepID=A0AAE3FN16_9EURY|nr:phosphoserine phosphatase SerB [Natranaeroarchaeum aerophilus]MCL9812318.1 phosphoserine phosphatase SerB [Natranaeroarchaeum aerophilus]